MGVGDWAATAGAGFLSYTSLNNFHITLKSNPGKPFDKIFILSPAIIVWKVYLYFIISFEVCFVVLTTLNEFDTLSEIK